jgi:hypothetical protein
MNVSTRTLTLLLAVSIASALLTGCGSSMYQPSKMANWSGVDSDVQINDEDIRKAFEARPQMPDKLSVAFFSFDPTKSEEIGKLLRGTPTVSNVYRIPSFLVDGSRRYAEPNHYSPQPHPPASIKQLRLLAARAQCDVLLVFDYGYKTSSEPNAWLFAAPLVVPIFVTPWLDVTAESYLDVYAIDTRNGYLYGQLDNSHENTEQGVTIYSAGRGQELVDEQWTVLQADAVESLVGLIKEERRLASVRQPEG